MSVNFQANVLQLFGTYPRLYRYYTNMLTAEMVKGVSKVSVSWQRRERPCWIFSCPCPHYLCMHRTDLVHGKQKEHIWGSAGSSQIPRQGQAQNNTTSSLFPTKAQPLTELVGELSKKRLSMCVLLRLHNLTASAEAWRWINWSMLCLACINAHRCTKVQGPHLLCMYLYLLSSQGTSRS